MKFTILTLFPEMVMSGLNESIIGRAKEKGIIDIEAVNIRDYTEDKHKKVDDYPYGGGAGMVLMPQPYVDAYESINKKESSITIMLSPQGEPLNEKCLNDEFKLNNSESIFKTTSLYDSKADKLLLLISNSKSLFSIS